MKRHGPATAVVALILTSLTACGNGDDIDCADAPEVTVRDTGDDPTERLQLSPREGDSVALDLRLDTGISLTADGSSVPTGSMPEVTLGMTVKVDRVSDDEIEMSFEYDKVGVDGDDPTVESTLGSLVGTSGTITTDANGVYLDGDVEAAAGMDPTMESMLQQLEQQLANMTVPLPTEAVGQGAVWEVESPIELNGLQACNTYTYTLGELDGSEYELDVEIDQEMEPGSVEQGGVEAELVEGSSSGSGTTRGNLEMPLGVTGDSEISSSSTMEVDQGGDSQEVETELTMSVTIDERT